MFYFNFCCSWREYTRRTTSFDSNCCTQIIRRICIRFSIGNQHNDYSSYHTSLINHQTIFNNITLIGARRLECQCTVQSGGHIRVDVAVRSARRRRVCLVLGPVRYVYTSSFRCVGRVTPSCCDVQVWPLSPFKRSPPVRLSMWRWLKLCCQSLRIDATSSANCLHCFVVPAQCCCCRDFVAVCFSPMRIIINDCFLTIQHILLFQMIYSRDFNFIINDDVDAGARHSQACWPEWWLTPDSAEEDRATNRTLQHTNTRVNDM